MDDLTPDPVVETEDPKPPADMQECLTHVYLEAQVGTGTKDNNWARLACVDEIFAWQDMDLINVAMAASFKSLDKRQTKKCLRFFGTLQDNCARRPDLFKLSHDSLQSLTEIRKWCSECPLARIRVQ